MSDSENEKEKENVETSKHDEKKESKLTREKFKKIIISVILWLTVIGLFIVVIGGIWAIGDIFSQNKFASFLELSIQSKLFITGLILLGIFFLMIFLVVLYKRGRNTLSNSLFKEIETKHKENTEEFLLAKIITGGGLLSFSGVFIGLIIAFFQLIFGAVTTEDPLGKFIQGLSGGSLVLISGITLLILDGLIYGIIYTWENGYFLLISKILKYNREFEDEKVFSKNEKISGYIIFGVIILEIVGIVFGIVWSIVELITSNWGAIFRDYLFGIQITFFGIFGLLLFATLILSMFFYKRGNYSINFALFIQTEIEEAEKKNIQAKLIAIGMLAGVSLLIISLLIWLITLIAKALSGEDMTNIFTALASLSGGLSLLVYSGIFAIFTILALLFIYLLHNGYVFTIRKILKVEKAIYRKMP